MTETSDWKLPWPGGCRCARIRLAVTRPPLLASACHCTGCQLMTSSACSLTLTVPADGFEVTEGEPELGGLHGPEAHHFHCPHCKTWLFTRAEGMDWFVNLRPSALDDHRWFVPFLEVWTSEKLPWVTTPARHSYETQPEFEDYEGLIHAFAAEGARPGAG